MRYAGRARVLLRSVLRRRSRWLNGWLLKLGRSLVSSSCGGRAATVAAPVHIVVASVAQLVPNLTTLFLKVREKGTAERNSMLCLITGSSRTADIEKTLVMGAHGPRRLIVVLDLERK